VKLRDGTLRRRDLQSNADLRKFVQLANRRYFGGKLRIAKIEFSTKLEKRFHGKTHTVVYTVDQRDGGVTELETYQISINSRLRRWRDLCMMTVYHEMVHADLYARGLSSKDNSCRKSGAAFNQRMTELAQAGAFNGLW
jgi:hypothetical protein